jgi:hypothetical protein
MRRVNNSRIRLGTVLIGAVICTTCAHQPLSPREQVMAQMESMHETVDQEIHETQRAAQAHRAIDALGRELIGVQEQVASARTDALALNARPDATRADFEAL